MFFQFYSTEIENDFQLGYYSLWEGTVQVKKEMTLTELPIGQNARVSSIDKKNRITKRLMEMGVVPGVSVEVVKTAPFGDPIEVRVRGYSLAMRRNEADAVTVNF